MESDCLDIRLPIDCNELIESLTNNCSAVEQLALDTLGAQHLPFLNTLRTLTRRECWMLLRKYRNRFNVLEQAVFLCAVTDHVTCACENSELFYTFRRKHDRDGIPALLLHLQSHWMTFFKILKNKDLTLIQLMSLIFLLRKSVERLTDRSYKFYLSEVLEVMDVCLTRFKNDSEQSLQNRLTCMQSASSREIQKNKLEEKVTVIHIHNDSENTPLKKKDIPAKHERWCEDVGLENKTTVLVQNKPRRKAFTSDITKYILKACNNKQTSHVAKNKGMANDNKTVTQDSLAKHLSGTVPCLKTEQPVQLTPPTKAIDMDVDSPIKQSNLNETVMPDGKVNAFALMMGQSKGSKKRKVSTLISLS